MTRKCQGMSLIELMIAITIFALLVILGTPMYTTWISNTKIRNAAESIQNGLRVARNEAIKRAEPVRFEINHASAPSWTVCVPVAATPSSCAGGENLQVHDANDATTAVRIGGTTNSVTAASTATDVSSTSALNGGITFSSLGRAITTTAPLPLLRIDASSSVSGARRLAIPISPGGSVRMCDPQLSQVTSPQGCS